MENDNNEKRYVVNGTTYAGMSPEAQKILSGLQFNKPAYIPSAFERLSQGQ